MRPLGGHRRGAVLRPDELRGSGVSPDWSLMRRILALLASDDGLADDQLAERLGAHVADVRQASRVLYRQRKADYCAGRVVIVPSARKEGKAA